MNVILRKHPRFPIEQNAVSAQKGGLRYQHLTQTRTYGSESATGQPTIMTEINKNNFQFIWGLFELF